MYGIFWGDIKLVSLQLGEVSFLFVRDLYCVELLFVLKVFLKYFQDVVCFYFYFFINLKIYVIVWVLGNSQL